MHSKCLAIRQDCQAFFAHQSPKTAGPCPWRQKTWPPSLARPDRRLALRTAACLVRTRQILFTGAPLTNAALAAQNDARHFAARNRTVCSKAPLGPLPPAAAAKLRNTPGRAIFDAELEKFARIALQRCRLAGLRRHFAVRNRRTLCGCQAVRWRSHEQSSGLFEHTVRFCRFAAKCGPCFWPASTLDAALRENCPFRGDAFLRQHAFRRVGARSAFLRGDHS